MFERSSLSLETIARKSCGRSMHSFKANSALLRHELAYVLGQMQDSHAVPTLIDVLSDENEHVVSRAAEALGAIGDLRAKPVLETFLNDLFRGIRICEVALDLLALCQKASRLIGSPQIQRLYLLRKNEGE